MAKRKENASSIKASDKAAVDAYFDTCDHPMKDTMQEIRSLILATDEHVGEEIAWNAPAFFYTGAMIPFNAKEYKRHIVVFNLFKKDEIRLVFLKGGTIDDTTGLLTGNYPDGRRLASFKSTEQVLKSAADLKEIVSKLLSVLIAENSPA